MPKRRYKHYLNTPASKVFEDWRAINICSKGVERAISFYTLRGDKTALDMAKAPMDIPTLCWDIYFFGADTAPELRKVMLEHISDQMTAFSLYISCPFLDDEDDNMLKAKFQGKLPTAEKELIDGKVTRTKLKEL